MMGFQITLTGFILYVIGITLYKAIGNEPPPAPVAVSVMIITFGGMAAVFVGAIRVVWGIWENCLM